MDFDLSDTVENDSIPKPENNKQPLKGMFGYKVNIVQKRELSTYGETLMGWYS